LEHIDRPRPTRGAAGPNRLRDGEEIIVPDVLGRQGVVFLSLD
jgi:hypothetical protein